MSLEERLRQALSEAATDPGVKQEWDAFIRTARRDRARHRLKIAAVSGAIGATVALGVTFGNDLLDQSLPRPAEQRQDQREEAIEEEFQKAEDRALDTEKLVEGPLIAPGPGVARGAGRQDGGVIASEDAVRGQASNPENERIERASATCSGKPATIVGTPDDDVLRGTTGTDVISALGGNDTIRGGDGVDYICSGNDIDHVYGDGGRDSLVGGAGDDYLDGGAGLDFVHFPNAVPHVNVDLSEGTAEGEGTDVVVRVEGAEGTESDDNFIGTDGVDIFVGRGGPDTVNAYGGADIFFPGPGDDAFGGFGGIDTVNFTAPGGVKVDLSRERATGEGVDFISSVENVTGTSGDDVISGDEKPNGFHGGGGDDTMSGGIGADLLIGDAGNDMIDGGPYEDSLDGGAGNDTCTNGERTRRCETTGPLGAAALLSLLALTLRARCVRSSVRYVHHRRVTRTRLVNELVPLQLLAGTNSAQGGH